MVMICVRWERPDRVKAVTDKIQRPRFKPKGKPARGAGSVEKVAMSGDGEASGVDDDGATGACGLGNMVGRRGKPKGTTLQAWMWGDPIMQFLEGGLI